MLLFYLALAAAILAGVAGQLLLKAGADAETVWAQLLRPSTIVGLGFYGCGAFLYLIALRKIPVSVAFRVSPPAMRWWPFSAISSGTNRSACRRSAASC